MRAVAIFILCMGVLSSCVSKNLISEASLPGYTEEFPVEEPSAEVCVLYYPSDFKNALKLSLAQDLNEMNVAVKADIISNGAAYSPAEYDAVILLSEVQAFHPFPLVASYIKYHHYASNIVYFSTYAAFNLPYLFSLRKGKIDAITSASVLDDQAAFDEVQEEIMTKTLSLVDL